MGNGGTEVVAPCRTTGGQMQGRPVIPACSLTPCDMFPRSLQMAHSGRRASDYVGELPPLPSSRILPGSALEAASRAAAMGERTSAMDTARYRLDPPSALPGAAAAGAEAWRVALDNAHAQLEHQHARIVNLELLTRYGPDAWRLRNDTLETTLRLLHAQHASAAAAAEEVNRERKLRQLETGRMLQALHEQYEALLAKNAEIELACQALEATLQSAAAQAQQPSANGVGPDSAMA